ncbi:NRPS [Arachnomyces sp. PD_36]|nr:NRPS [Arachnomyces sp. PD_36]
MANSPESSSPIMTRWCQYLADAPKPTFPPTYDSAAASAPSALRRRVLFSRKRSSPYSTATILRAAWSLVNAYYSDSEEDVVFGFAAPSSDCNDQDISCTALPARFQLNRSQAVVDCLRGVQEDSTLFSSPQVTLDGIKAFGSNAQDSCTFQNQLIIHEDMMTAASVDLDLAVNVECTLTRQGAIVQAFYDPTTIETKQMQRIMDLFESFLQQLCVEDPAQKVGDLASISNSDVKEIRQWNKTVPKATDALMHEIVSQKASESPDASALTSFEGDFTYGFLDDMSTRLAQHLLSKGVGPGKIVPFMFEKSAWTVFAMLAVLKTGAAFVPLDTVHAWTDSASLLASCGSTLVLCSPMHAERFRQNSVEIVVVQPSFMDSLPPARGKMVTTITPKDAAYIIFTSGSTGKPKGIVCSHQAWCTNAIAHGTAELITPNSRCLQFSAYTFDISLSDIFTTLAFGGCVCVPSDSERMNDLSGAMRRMRVNQAALTPTVAKFLKPADVPGLQVLKIGGESMTPEFVATWADNVRLMNSYGPAECTSRCSCTWTTTGDDPTVIGKALGSVLWVTQPHDPSKLAPIGAVGELLVEGPILATSYLNDPAKTAGTFIDSPSWLTDAFPERVGKVYRTGDLVQYTSDGRLRFIGRRDTQIKFNGIRLECGDIESKIMAQAPEGYQVVVDKVVVAGRDGKQLLAAFVSPPRNIANEDLTSSPTVVVSADQKALITELRQNLSSCMPSFMTPQLFVPLTFIPLGATGKTNRKALQALAAGLTEDQLNQCTDTQERAFEAPLSDMQKTLCKLWAEVLRISEASISAQDTFFKLGGDSVSAMQLVAASRELNIILTVSDVFQCPKLSDLAQLLDSSEPSDSNSYEVEPFSLVGGASRSLRDQLKTEYRIPTPLIEDVYPCTPLQEAIMAETMTSPEAYILQEVLKIPNNVDIETLKDAWETVVQDSPILRTRIVLLDKLGTCQVVLSDMEPIDWKTGSDVSSYLESDKKAHMSYGDPLCRFAIVQHRNGDLFLVWTAHHAITDGWMHTTVLEQVKRVYNNQQITKGPEFSSFINYLAQQKDGEAGSYWQSRFENLELTKFLDWNVSYQPRISETMDKKISITRDGSSFTTAILIRAAWSLVLAQYSSTTDLVLGITQAGRDVPLPGVETCLGPTLSTVPVRVSVDYQETVSEYLTRLQDEFVKMIPFQHTGLQNIKRISPQCADACDFHNLLVVQPAVAEDPSFLTRQDCRNAGEELGFGLLMECFLGNGEVKLHAGFDTNVIPAAQVSRILCQLENTLQQLSKQSNQSVAVGRIDVFSPRDSQDLISWNGEQPPPTNNCMHWMVERQAAARPDAPAVDSWDAQFTYGELDAYANRLAGHLVQLGVGPETIVPFIFEKSAWTVVALLATLKAGGACVALDVSHPSSRHKKIVGDADARVILASSEQARSLDLGVQVVPVDRASIEALPNKGLPDNHSGAGPRNAAFVVYSSGSTGTPKGSILEHASLCATSRTNSEYLSMGTSSRVIQFASYAFDVAIEENIITLMYGSCICIPSAEERLNDLAGAMRRLRVTWADLTPTVARMLNPDDIPSLKTLVMGGEALSQDIIDAWASRVDLINTYGPSECSIQATASKKLGTTAMGANIGRPVNCRLWIVDAADHNRLQPVGCVGELLIEGEIVGRGYLKEPEKTKSVFIENPAWAVSSSSLPRRFYKTGDLAKYNEDGTLSCLGRKDTQIKLHGQRIELGEIEHSLKVHSSSPDETQVVVEAFTPSSNQGRKLLIAFLLLPAIKSSSNETEVEFATISDSTRAGLMQLKDSVSQALPEYMVPSFFAPLNKLPTNTSGKTDRKQLRAMAENMSHSQLSLYSLANTTKTAASTDVEKKLQELWASVLNINVDTDPIGANDGFLQLGGDSITAMQLVGKARKVGFEISVSEIFRSPKLSEMAAAIKQVNKQPEEVVVVHGKKPSNRFQMVTDRMPAKKLMKSISSAYDIDRDMVQDVYPCTPLQEGLMALTAEDSGAYVLQDVFELPKDIDIDQFKAAWASVVRETAILRTRIAFIEGIGSCQVVVDGRIKWRKSKSLSGYLEKDRAKAMKYGKALSRYAIVDDGHRKRFVWTIHHALYDGYSYNLTLEKVHHAYQNDLSVPRSTPYSSFIQYLGSVKPEASGEFWRQQLDGVEVMNFPQLPAGHQPSAGSILDYTIAFGRKSNTGITTSSLLRAAWSLLVASYSGCKDVVFGVTQSGRDVPLQDVESIVGPTITTVPVRIQVPEGVEVRRFLEDIQNQTTAMIPYAHTGLQNIKRLSESAQVACSFQNLLVIQPSDGNSEGESIFASHEVVAQANYLKSFGIVLECGLSEGEINVCAHYDSAIIPASQMQRIVYQFEHIISQLSSEKGLVDNVEIFSPQDKQEQASWNGTYPEVVSKCIHQIIQQQAQNRPNAIAVVSRNDNITYTELDQLTTHLAHTLQDLGVGPETLVPICIEKSPQAIIAMLAIQKAGGAFVPLNPKDPVERLQDLIDQTEARHIIVTKQTSHLVSKIGFTDHVVELPSSMNQWYPLNTTNVTSRVGPSNTAYALFTSGSTGRPKAVVIEHRAVSSSTAGHGEAMGFNLYPRRVLQFATYTFDACIAEIFTTLTHGGCVCVPSESERMDDIVKFIADFKVDWAFFTPSFVQLIRPESVPSLKTVVLGGEAMTQDNVDVWGSKVHLMNGYGPTETCVFCVTHVASRQCSQSIIHKPETIGRAVSSLSWVVEADNHNRLVPIGCAGELLVQGPSLARGYLKEPTKTAEAFIESPAWLQDFGYSHPQMLYKTGDLVRYNSDGTLTYLGRKDNQVKVNGQRLELGEIEDQLASKSPAGSQVVVVAGKPKCQASKQTLAAFVCFSNDECKPYDSLVPMSDALRSTIQDLEFAMRQVLPGYMVPSLWIPMGRIPTTISGKTDRKTLGALLRDMSSEHYTMYSLAVAEESSGRAPSTDLERRLQKHVAKILAKDPQTIGADDSFFRLGGDSISAIQLVAAARADGLSLTTEDIFRQPKISEMAKVVRTEGVTRDAVDEAIAPFSLLDSDSQESLLDNVVSEYNLAKESIEDLLPCTPLQEGLIALTTKDPEAYVLRDIFRLPRDLDIERFKAAWETVVLNSAILRTRIVNIYGCGSFQVVTKDTITWKTGDDIKSYVADDMLHPFRYGFPLSRFAIVDSKWDGRYFVWTIHHSLYDGWSYGLMLNQVQQVYQDQSPKPAPPFNTFIKYLKGIDQEACDTFWREQFAPLEARQFPRKPSPTFEPMLDKSITTSIPVTRKPNSSLTMSTILKGAWAVLLSRYTGAQDALFGVTQTGRNAAIAGITEMLGPTIATVPLRVALDHEAPITNFLEGIQKQTTDMIRYEHAGLQNIQRLSPQAREACAFSNILVIQPDGQTDIDFLGTQKVRDMDKNSLGFGLGIECILKADSIFVTAGFDGRLIPEEQMQRMLHQFAAAVQQLNLELPQTIGDIMLFSPEDKAEVLRWNSNMPERVNECAHDVIQRRVQVVPGATAVNAWDVDLTYWELDSLSTKLAHCLRSMGIGPGYVVPLCFEKSGWSIVAILAVMKAGGAFVFLDPAYPMARLQEIVNQVEAKHVLTSLKHAGLWRSRMEVMIVDQVSIESLPTHTDIPETGVTPHDALYVIFTSGSTGKPKGCVVEHSSFLTGAKAQAECGNMTASSRVLQVASYSFDVSILEIITALTVGACICVPNERAKSRGIANVINNFHINWAFLTPSVVKLIKPEDVPNLRTLILGGEALSTHDVETWAEHLQLVNGYGPSECSIAAAGNPHLTRTTDPANIGRAIGGVCWITEAQDHNRLAPIGTVGELLIEGPIVARGYLNNPEKTAEVFIENPAWAEKVDGQSSRRLYKTGDLVHYNPDGTINFIGRKDNQVKVRGQRLELGEIESHLSVNPEIGHSMILYPGSGPCKAKLVAVLTLKELAGVTAGGDSIEIIDSDSAETASGIIAELSQKLARIIPAYMIPNIWIVVKGVPFLPSGKMNRKRIDQWIGTMDEKTYHRVCGLGNEGGGSIAPPSTIMEAQLQKIWSTVLRLPIQDIGVKHSFTTLGGDSISAMQVVAQCRKEGINISLQQIFQCKTIALIAQAAKSSSDAPSIVEEKTNELFDLTPIQQFYADFTLGPDELSKSTNARFNHTFCLHVKKPLLAADLARAMETLVGRHSMLRARFQQDSSAPSGWKQLVTDNIDDSFHFCAWNNITLDQARPCLEEARIALDIENGPICAADLVTVDQDTQYLFIVAHHLVVDMVSWNVILRDLEELLSTGALSSEKPFPFSSWAKLQKEYASEHLKPEAVLPVSIPPADFSYWNMQNRINVVRDIREHSFTMPVSTTTSLLTTCNKTYNTEPMDILVSTLSHAFSFVFKDRDPPTIFKYNHGREPWTPDIDVSQTVGWYTTLSPIHVPIRGKEDSISVLRRTMATRRKIPNNGYNYFCSRYLHPEGIKAFSSHNEMEVSINYLGSQDGLKNDTGGLFELPTNFEGGLGAAGQEVKCFSLFSISASVEDGKLGVHCVWNKYASHQDSIRRWFRVFERLLQDVANRSLPRAVREAQGLTQTKSSSLAVPSHQRRQRVR